MKRKSLVATKAKEVTQIKPRLSQGRAGLRCKIKMPASPPISEPIIQVLKKSIQQSEILVSKTSKVPNKIKPDYAIPDIVPHDSGSRMVERKAKQDVNKEIPMYPYPVYRPPPKPVKLPIPKIPRSLLDIDLEINTDFEENSPFQEGLISETYQRPDKSNFQEP